MKSHFVDWHFYHKGQKFRFLSRESRLLNFDSTNLEWKYVSLLKIFYSSEFRNDMFYTKIGTLENF